MPDLKELLGDELHGQVMEKLGDKNKVAIIPDENHILIDKKAGDWIPKERFNELNEEKKQYKESSDKLKGDLDEMAKKAKGNDELTKQIDGLKGQLEDSQGKIKDISVNSAIERELLKANAKFPDLLVGKFNKEKIEVLEDGTVKGLEDQLKPLKENYKDLFGEEKITGGDPGKGGDPNPDPDVSKMTDEEYYKHVQEQQKK